MDNRDEASHVCGYKTRTFSSIRKKKTGQRRPRLHTAARQLSREFLLLIRCRCSKRFGRNSTKGCACPGIVPGYRIVGITYSAPARIPAGQRAVTVFKRL